MSFFDSDTLLYIILIAVFLAFFLWNRNQSKKRREHKKHRSFRNRYHERKNREK
ncbi:hypothetical protein JRG66_12845 [Salinimicrobium tongyeongense]|uniref:Uncharacterized protein n=1 Tax=Salinimicrobium tongyeongense TaxID=2809707 RepID=A0ABY6NPP3_9FLAO|nr:hypothetical protein [Salinimicrobium tongyeongense]UZH54847.1 hypothetical protein JRG66_12845 [Salinimicrobium tongyeongense]